MTAGSEILELVRRELAKDLNVLASRIVEQIGVDLESYIDRSSGVSVDEVKGNVRRHLEVFLETLGGVQPSEHESADTFAVDSARHRAELGLTAESVVRTFVVASEVVWDWLVGHGWGDSPGLEVVTSAWPVWQKYVNHASAEVSSVYREIELERLAAGAEAKAALVQRLVDRTIRTADAQRMLVQLGVPSASELMLVLLESPDREGAPFDLARGVVRSLVGRLEAFTGVAPLLHLRGRRVVLLCQSVAGGADALRAELGRVLHGKASRGLHLAGVVSDPIVELATVADTYFLADRALETVAGRGRIIRLTDVRLSDYAAHALGADAVVVCPEELRVFINELQTNHPEWEETLHCWMAASMNVKLAAEMLHVHVNTMYYRIEQIAKLSGVDIRDFETLADIALVMRLRPHLNR